MEIEIILIEALDKHYCVIPFQVFVLDFVIIIHANIKLVISEGNLLEYFLHKILIRICKCN